MKKSYLWVYGLQILLFILSIPILMLVSYFMLEVFHFSMELLPIIVNFKWPLYILLGLANVLCLLIVFDGIRILFNFIHNRIYSNETLSLLINAHLKSIVISGIFVLFLPFFYVAAELDDAPGLVIVGVFFVGLTFAFALLLKFFKQLVVQAIAFKREND